MKKVMYFFIAGITLCVSVSAQSELTYIDFESQTEAKQNSEPVIGVFSESNTIVAPRIHIRHGGTYLTKTNPLILIDNVESSSDLSGLLPGNIESITILKDFKALEIYGARAADGVIIITTKRSTKNLNESEKNIAIAETENSLESDCVTSQMEYDTVPKIETDIIEVTETENTLEPDWVITQLEYEVILDIETDNIGETGMENQFPDLKIYPNPFSGMIYLTGAEDCTLRVVAENGDVVHTQKLINPIETILLEHLRVGVYFFWVSNGKQTKILKGVKN